MKIRKKFLIVFAVSSIVSMVIITWIISNVVEGSLINSGLLMSEVQGTVNDVRIYVFTVGLSFLAILFFPPRI